MTLTLINFNMIGDCKMKRKFLPLFLASIFVLILMIGLFSQSGEQNKPETQNEVTVENSASSASVLDNYNSANNNSSDDYNDNKTLNNSKDNDNNYNNNNNNTDNINDINNSNLAKNSNNASESSNAEIAPVIDAEIDAGINVVTGAEIDSGINTEIGAETSDYDEKSNEGQSNNVLNRAPNEKDIVSEENAKSAEKNETKVITDTDPNETKEIISLGKLKVHFIDVGQADSILIQDSGGSTMLIDAGNNEDADLVVNYLKEHGIDKLDYVIGTHPHEDHIGGLDAVINTFNIGKVIMPKVSHNTKTFEDVLTAIKNKNLKVTSPVPGESYNLGNAKFTILAPNSDNYDNLNDYSIVIKLEFGETSFLFAGDAETKSENEMIVKGFNLKANVLKVGHHGSTTSSSLPFIKAIAPKYAVISVGKHNSYGHPDSIILNRFKTLNVEVLRTDILGTIVFTSDGKNLTYTTENVSTINEVTPVTASNSNKANETNKTNETNVSNVSSETNASNETNVVNVTIEEVDLINELVIIKNNSNVDVDMTGWKLVSVNGNQVYYFPNNFVLKAGASVSIASGNAEGDLKWTKSNIWNNKGDPAELYDNKGNLVSSK